MKKRKDIFVLVPAWLVCWAVACNSSGEPAATAGENGSPAPAVAAVTAPGAATAPEPAKDPQAVVVTVNGKAITNAQVQEEQGRAMKQFEHQMPKGIPPAMMAQFRKQIVDMMVNRTLLQEAVKNEKIEISDADVDSGMSKIREKYAEPGAFEKMLASRGLTEAQAKDQMRQDLEMEKLVEAHVGPIQPAEAEVKEFYEKNQGTMSEPEKVQASHILIKVEKSDSEEVKKAKHEKIEGIKKKIAEGADFAQMARENSDCPSKAKGGDLGSFGRGQMVKPFEEAAFAMKPGETSGVVETEFGYHVIRVTNRTEAKKHDFEEVKEKIATHLNNQKRSQSVQKFLAEMRGKAKVEYAPGEAPEPPAPAPAVGGKDLPPGHPPVEQGSGGSTGGEKTGSEGGQGR